MADPQALHACLLCAAIGGAICTAICCACWWAFSREDKT